MSRNRGMAQNSEFEFARRAMLQLYHSNIQTHAGYIITIGVGLAALAANYSNFVERSIVPSFWVLVLAFIGFALYALKRIFLWTVYTSAVIAIPEYKAEKLFMCWYLSDSFRRESEDREVQTGYWRDSAPFTLRLQCAIDQHLIRDNDNEGNIMFIGTMRVSNFAFCYTLAAVGFFIFINSTYNFPISVLTLGLANMALYFVAASSAYLMSRYIWREQVVGRIQLLKNNKYSLYKTEKFYLEQQREQKKRKKSLLEKLFAFLV